MKKQWFQNGKRIIQNGKRILCADCPCGAEWVAVGIGAEQVYTSLNAENWKEQASPFDDKGRKITHNGSLWIAAGGDYGWNRFAKSEDGKIWFPFDVTGVNATGYAVGYGNGRWLIGGSFLYNAVHESIDNGHTWTRISLPTGVGIVYDASYNGSNWLVCGSYGAAVGDSNAHNWVLASLPLGVYSCIKWADGLWVIGGTASTIYTSPDGINWTGRSSPLSQVLGIDWNGSLLVAVGSGTYAVATSPDAINWTGRSSPFTRSYGVAWGSDTWTAVGSGTYAMATSAAGITWTGKTSTLTEGLGIAHRVTL